MATVNEVNSFLEVLRAKVHQGIPIAYIGRRKNLIALTQLALAPQDRTTYILGLTSDDYSGGPSPDHHGGTDVWVFGIRIDNKEIYIKITLKEGTNPCTCISFHLAEYPMNYPLRQ